MRFQTDVLTNEIQFPVTLNAGQLTKGSPALIQETALKPDRSSERTATAF